MKKLGFALLLLAIALMLGGTALAQNTPIGDNSVYFTTYFANNVAAAPDEYVRIVNDGDSAVNKKGVLWASIYVFDDSQELTECCSCPVTYDGLLSESVQHELTTFPITSRVPTRGVIKVISSTTEADVNTDFAPNKPAPGLRVWATHTQRAQLATGAYYVTETLAADSNLTAGEQAMLEQLCLFDNLLSGYPCICTPEDHDF